MVHPQERAFQAPRCVLARSFLCPLHKANGSLSESRMSLLAGNSGGLVGGLPPLLGEIQAWETDIVLTSLHLLSLPLQKPRSCSTALPTSGRAASSPSLPGRHGPHQLQLPVDSPGNVTRALCPSLPPLEKLLIYWILACHLPPQPGPLSFAASRLDGGCC